LTFVTPGAAQAALTASSWSAQELTVPRSVTVPLELSTETIFASSFAFWGGWGRFFEVTYPPVLA
jgi:hypothetical protein